MFLHSLLEHSLTFSSPLQIFVFMFVVDQKWLRWERLLFSSHNRSVFDLRLVISVKVSPTISIIVCWFCRTSSLQQWINNESLIWPQSINLIIWSDRTRDVYFNANRNVSIKFNRRLQNDRSSRINLSSTNVASILNDERSLLVVTERCLSLFNKCFHHASSVAHFVTFSSRNDSSSLQIVVTIVVDSKWLKWDDSCSRRIIGQCSIFDLSFLSKSRRPSRWTFRWFCRTSSRQQWKSSLTTIYQPYHLIEWKVLLLVHTKMKDEDQPCHVIEPEIVLLSLLLNGYLIFEEMFSSTSAMSRSSSLEIEDVWIVHFSPSEYVRKCFLFVSLIFSLDAFECCQSASAIILYWQRWIDG